MSEQPKKKKESIPLLIFSLCLIAVVAAIVLSVFASITEKPIKQAIINTTLETFKTLQPDFDNEPLESMIVLKLDGNKWELDKNAPLDIQSAPDIVKVYPAKKDNKLVSLFIDGTSPYGYAGNVTVLTAVSINDTVINVEVTQSQETAGLGSNVYSRELRKTIWGIFKGEYKDMGDKLIPNPILDYFRGKMYIPDDQYTSEDKTNPNIVPASKWKVEKDGGNFKYITGATITSRTVTDAVKRILQAYYQNKTELLKIFEK